MTETEWLASTDPQTMLIYARATLGVPGAPSRQRLSDRKLRLFAVACCRAVWDGVVCQNCEGRGAIHPQGMSGWTCASCRGTGKVGGLTDPRSRRAVEVAERYADGEATEEELRDAEIEAAFADGFPGYNVPAWAAESAVGLLPHEAAENAITHSGCLPATQAALLREVFGNPFHIRGGAGFISSLPSGGMSAGIHEPGGLPSLPSILRWNDGTVPRVAQRQYDSGFQEMDILRDALLDAGCEDEEILNHCQKSQHVKGCWVIDLLLGRF